MAAIRPLVKISEFWSVLQTRLNTADMAVLLGGMDRVYRLMDNFDKPEGELNEPWGRVVLVPTVNLWGDTANDSTLYKPVSWLVRVELNPYISPGYDASYILEAIHSYVNDQLEGFAPVLDEALVYVPVYMNRAPQSYPMWDDERHLYFTSAEWRAELAYKIPSP